MQFAVEHGPAFAWLRVRLEQGESIDAEAGAMVTRSPALEMDTRLNAGRSVGLWQKFKALFVAILRKVLGGETMFINRFSGPQGGEVVLAPRLSGHVVHRKLAEGERLVLQSGAYLASTGGIEARIVWGGLRGLLGGEGLFFLECRGPGDLFLNSYGGIREVPVDGRYVVDTGHIVAFDGSLDFKLRGAGNGLKSLFFSGEGLVCEFQGRGTVYVQSRNLGALVGWISPFLRT